MLKKLKYQSSTSLFIHILFYKVYIFFRYRIMGDMYYIKKKFRKKFGYDLDLNNPISMNEKIQWYKLNHKDPLISNCADKFSVREYISDTIGDKYLIPLILETKDPRDIRPDNLPDYPFIIKANHTAGTNHIIKDKSNVDWKKVQFDCKWWLNLNYYHYDKEWQYNGITPRIVVEKLLIDSRGKIPFDYKLHFFGGEFEFLQVDMDRFEGHKRNFYDKDWNLLPFNWSPVDKDNNFIYPNGGKIEQPKYLSTLIELGAKLAEPFPYVRVDFYVHNDAIYFGELTFHHGSGFEVFIPKKWDSFYGKKVPLIK